MPRKVMDVSRLQALGWSAQTPFEEGIKQAYNWYVANVAVSEASSANAR
jgi:GDP-L-fucose synthase